MIIASIDIGTNTVLLLIAEVDPTTFKFKSIVNLQRIPRIGKGLVPGQPIKKEKIEMLYSVLQEYSRLISENKCEIVLVKATNAFRIASNNRLLTDDIKTKFNIDIKVVTGKEEAMLSFLGATSNYNSKYNFLVIDIGGGSTELIYGKKNKINFTQSFPVGVVSGTEIFYKSNPPTYLELDNFNNSIKQQLKEIASQDILPDKVIAIAGTPTTLACINQDLTEYNEDLIEGALLRYVDLEKIIITLSSLTSQEIKQKYKDIVNGREDVLLAGSQILATIMNMLNIDEVTVSTKGIRYGAIVDFVKNKFKDSGSEE